jgi:hypothetical protein
MFSAKLPQGDRQEDTAEGGQHARRDDRPVAHAVDRDAHRVGCARMLADRADAKADRRLEEDDVGEDHSAVSRMTPLSSAESSPWKLRDPNVPRLLLL